MEKEIDISKKTALTRLIVSVYADIAAHSHQKLCLLK